jgi:hypothetical protein
VNILRRPLSYGRHERAYLLHLTTKALPKQADNQGFDPTRSLAMQFDLLSIDTLKDLSALHRGEREAASEDEIPFLRVLRSGFEPRTELQRQYRDYVRLLEIEKAQKERAAGAASIEH